jgi:hypothetical protein
MTTEIEKGNESQDICAVILAVVITIISLIGGAIYYINLFGAPVIVLFAGGILVICLFSMLSKLSKPRTRATSSQIACPACGKGVTYNYKSKDAFGRVACSFCGMIFSPSKYQDSVPSSVQQPLELPRGNPRPLVRDCRDSEAAASMANTRLSYSVTRNAIRGIVDSLGIDRMQAFIQAGFDYLDANRLAAALACFYEAELITFEDERLVELRARFNRPGRSFNSIAEEYFRDT